MSRGVSIFLLAVLLIALGISAYLLYENLPFGEQQELKVQNPAGNDSITGAESSGGESYAEGEMMQFYSNMRYPRLPISYSISSECRQEKAEQMQSAIEIISDKAGISFAQVSGEGNIAIRCRELGNKETRNKDFYVAGEGGPSEIINTSLFYVISKGEVLLLRESTCSEPLVSMHEILHALGFGHSANPLSIMYNISDCRQKLTEDIINELKRLYSIESLPDLYSSSINATKNGRYLSFDIEVRNRGLISSENTTLSIYAADEKVGSFDIEVMEIGAGIVLNVENLRLPSRSTNEVRFVIDAENSVRELSEDNNIAVLSVE